MLKAVSLLNCLTGFVCKDRRSRTPPPLEGQLEEGWHRTRMGCVCRCDRPCVCTDPNLQARPHKACSQGFPPHCPRRSSPLCSFSARCHKNNQTLTYQRYKYKRPYHNIKIGRVSEINTLVNAEVVWTGIIQRQPYSTDTYPPLDLASN